MKSYWKPFLRYSWGHYMPRLDVSLLKHKKTVVCLAFLYNNTITILTRNWEPSMQADHAAWPLLTQPKRNKYIIYRPYWKNHEHYLTNWLECDIHPKNPTMLHWKDSWGVGGRGNGRQQKTNWATDKRPPHTGPYSPSCVWEKHFPLYPFLGQQKNSLIKMWSMDLPYSISNM